MAVLRMAIFDLGAWCKHCHSRRQKCPNRCHQVRQDALAFLRGEDTTLEFWAARAGMRPEPIKAFFSSGQETTWIPAVITLRSPYRRARKGASAPQEASFADLWGAYKGSTPITIECPASQ